MATRRPIRKVFSARAPPIAMESSSAHENGTVDDAKGGFIVAKFLQSLNGLSCSVIGSKAFPIGNHHLVQLINAFQTSIVQAVQELNVLKDGRSQIVSIQEILKGLSQVSGEIISECHKELEEILITRNNLWITMCCSFLLHSWVAIMEEFKRFSEISETVAKFYQCQLDAILPFLSRRLGEFPSTIALRPAPMHQMIHIHTVFESFTESRFILRLCFLDLPIDKSLNILAAFRFGKECGEKLIDYSIAKLDSIQAKYFLIKDSIKYFEEILQNMEDVIRRIFILASLGTSLTFFTGLCSILRAPTWEHANRLIESLLKTGDYYVSHRDSKRLEISSISLREPRLRKRFYQELCDREDIFQEDYILTFFVPSDLDQVYLPPIEGTEQIEIPFWDREESPLTVIVAGKNSFLMQQFVADVVDGFCLVNVAARASHHVKIDKWLKESKFSIMTFTFIFFRFYEIFRAVCEAVGHDFVQLKALNFMMRLVVAVMTLNESSLSCCTYASFLWRPSLLYLLEFLVRAVEHTCSVSIEEGTRILMQATSLFSFCLYKCPDATFVPCSAIRDIKYVLRRLKGLSQPKEDAPADYAILIRCLEVCSERLATNTFSSAQRLSAGIQTADIDVLGQAKQGSVYKCLDREMNLVIAIKEVQAQSTDEQEQAFREIEYLKYLRYPFIVPFYGVCICDNTALLKMEYCYEGSLADFLKEVGPIKDTTHLSRFLMQILVGLAGLHANGFAHGDLKPANILVDIFEIVRLADFGAVRSLVSNGNSYRRGFVMGTAQYLSPEAARNGATTLASDIWAVGCTAFEMVTGIVPWSQECNNPWSIIYALGHDHMFSLEPLYARQDALGNKTIEIIESCLNPDPDQRPTVFDLIFSPVFYAENLDDSQIKLTSSKFVPKN